MIGLLQDTEAGIVAWENDAAVCWQSAVIDTFACYPDVNVSSVMRSEIKRQWHSQTNEPYEKTSLRSTMDLCINTTEVHGSTYIGFASGLGLEAVVLSVKSQRPITYD